MKRNLFTLIILSLTALPVIAQEEDVIAETVAGLPLDVFAYLVAGIMALLIGTAVAWLFAGFTRPERSAPITGLLAFTGIIHLFIGFTGDILLLLNGIGYFILLGVQFLPVLNQARRSRILDSAAIAYAVVTIIGYFVVHDGISTIGIVTKIGEIALVFALAGRIMVATESLRDTTQTV